MTPARRRQAILAALTAVTAAELAAGLNHHAGNRSHPDQPGADTHPHPVVIAPAQTQPTQTQASRRAAKA